MSNDKKQIMANDYVALFRHYISLTKEFEFTECIEKSTSYTLEVLNKISEEQGDFSYAEDKWTTKQLIRVCL